MSKFLGPTAYDQDQGYQLLPFKFERLHDDKYVITNLVGEFLVLKDKDLHQLVEKQIPSSSHITSELRSKHFIRYPGETSPPQLLGLKLRTKYRCLADFTSLHIFVVTLRCDHSCPYCQVSRQTEDKSSFDMSQSMADKALDFVFRSPSPSIKIEFQGGEPLLNFELIQYIVEQAKIRNQEANRQLGFVIATTLSLITDDALEFCRQHSICLSSSLDGPEDLHNSNRPRPGKNSHQKFVDGLEKARSVLGYDQVSALMTTTDNSLPRVKEIIDEYLRLGFSEIFLRHLSPYGFAIKTKKYLAYSTEKWINFYKEGLDYIIQLNKAGIHFVEQSTATILTKMLTSDDAAYVDLMSPAGIGIAAIVFNYDGSVYASDESRMLAEMGDYQFRLGSVLDNTYEEIMLSDPLLNALEETFTQSVPMCSDCAFEPYCGADPIYHHAIHQDHIARKPDSEFCKRNMSIFKHLINLMQSDSETKAIFLKWANRC